ncbi:unnamed protein product [Pleuronectes platessa]|uniref:Uncharacterized protein n=1 Tax=Pleuronectes platessa TaxID=8262 RepID=A0A9N7VP48_PLEPL|nr:unnamed protein product [Pleuronectes platessa]
MFWDRKNSMGNSQRRPKGRHRPKSATGIFPDLIWDLNFIPDFSELDHSSRVSCEKHTHCGVVPVSQSALGSCPSPSTSELMVRPQRSTEIIKSRCSK